MEISQTNTGASTYAMKKAMEMPNLMLSLLEQIPDPGKQALGTKSSAATQILDPSKITGKGKIIDLIA